MTKENSTAVYIGRFQIFHNEHARVLRRAIGKYAKVVVLIGSSEEPRTTKNPFTYAERAHVITEWAETEFGPSPSPLIRPLCDYPLSNDRWVAEVKATLEQDNWTKNNPIVVVGSHRDDSTAYLNYMPTALRFSTDLVVSKDDVSASMYRDVLFSFDPTEKSAETCKEVYGLQDLIFERGLPMATRKFLAMFRTTAHYPRIAQEYAYQKKYAATKKAYPIKNVTADAVIFREKDGHTQVLLIKRKNLPGRGLWAIPGGHVDEYETTLDAAIREAHEETGLVLRKADIFADEWIETPHRSLLGRTITHAFGFNAKDASGKPKANDDASEATWFSRNQFRNMRKEMFDDHYHIVSNFFEANDRHKEVP